VKETINSVKLRTDFLDPKNPVDLGVIDLWKMRKIENMPLYDMASVKKDDLLLKDFNINTGKKVEIDMSDDIFIAIKSFILISCRNYTKPHLISTISDVFQIDESVVKAIIIDMKGHDKRIIFKNPEFNQGAGLFQQLDANSHKFTFSLPNFSIDKLTSVIDECFGKT
jgi:hypothetical protein